MSGSGGLASPRAMCFISSDKRSLWMPSRHVSAGPEQVDRRRATNPALLVVLLAGIAVFSVGACGRRGQPEPPPDPSAPAATQKPGASGRPGRGGSSATPNATPSNLVTRPNAGTVNDDEDPDDDPAVAVNPQPTPTPTGRKRQRNYQVPKEPFLLDPIL